MTFEGVEYQKDESWACRGRVAHFSCNMTVAHLPMGTLAEGRFSHGIPRQPAFPTGTLAEQTLGPPAARTCFSPCTTPAKGLVDLPDGGAPSHGHLGRADARPSRGEGMFLHGQRRWPGSGRSTGRWPAFPRAPWPSRRSALPRRGHGSLLALRRQRRGSPPYRIAVCLSTGVADISGHKGKGK